MGLIFSQNRDGRRVLDRQIKLLLAATFLAAASSLLPLDALHIPLASYVPMHTVLESLSILMAFLVFAVVWYTPSRESSASLVLVSTALLAAAGLDFLHMVSILGMPDFFTPSSSQKSNAFWLAARASATLGFCWGSHMSATLSLSNARRRGIAAAFALYVAAVAATVLSQESQLPTLFLDGVGTTGLKTAIESLFVLLLAWTGWRYYRLTQTSNEPHDALMFGAMAVGCVGELFFASYAIANDTQNLLGHIYKVISYGLIFQAMFISSIRKSYEKLAAQTEQLLKANEALRVQSLALESTATPVMVTDIRGVVTWRNRASIAVKPAFPQGEVRIFDRTLTPDPATAAQMQSMLAAGEVWRGRVRLISSQGQDLYFDRIVTPVRNADGDLVGYVSVSENMTTKVRTEERHKRILETALDGYWVMDFNARVLEVNEAYAKMSGYSSQELVGMRAHQLVMPEDVHDIQTQMLRIAERGHGRFQTRHRKKDGSALFVEVSVAYDADTYYVFIRDRTEHERSAAAKQDLERQLQHAQKMQALGQLTGGIAHDFNNILASILGYSNLALSRFAQDKESKLAKYLQEIVASSERARDLIAKMLTFTRTQPAGPMEAISPALVVKEVVAMLRPSIPSSIQLRCSYESEQSIRMDPGELNQALVNLIINARDAITEQGLIDIRVRTIQLHGAISAISHQRLFGDYVSIEVSDNGSGIPAEDLSSLFNPFFTTKEVGKGTGLGLSMVQGILQKWGGHVLVSSQVGRGSQFSLLLAAGAQAEVSSEQPESARADSTGTGQTVWIVDDEKAVAGYVGELLTEAGYQVRIFNSPVAALDAFTADRYKADLLITDQTMPGLNGVQLVSRMRKMRGDLPVIICTGFNNGIAAKELEQHRIQKMFVKPVAAHELLKTVAEILTTPAIRTP